MQGVRRQLTGSLSLCACIDITKDLKWQAKRALIGRLITPWRRTDKDKKGGDKV